MKCPNCNKEIADNSKFCPECGHNFSQVQQGTPVQPQPTPTQPVYAQPAQPTPKKKKPLWLKIVIGIVGLFILFAILGSCSDSSSSTSTSTQTTSGSDTSTPSSSDNSSSSSSSSSSLVSSSTPAGLYKDLSTIATIDFTINDKAKDFLVAHPELFPATSESACQPYIDSSIEYKHIAKNAKNYGDKLMKVYGQIVQTEEITTEDSGLSQDVSAINLIDANGNQYYIYYIGTNDLYEDDIVNVVGLPLDMSSFTNTDNGETLCPILAGCSIEKTE